MNEREIAAAGRRRTRALAVAAEATEAAKKAAQAGAAAGITEVRLGELLEVNRLTVRSWLGKK